ncbi:MAG: hypothetical protein ACOC9Y_08320, partial [Chloroflexota bacterium]
DAFGEYRDVYRFPPRQALPHDPTPAGVVVSEDGQVVVTRPGPPPGSLLRVGPDGAEDITPEQLGGTSDSERPFTFNPASLAIGPDGLLYVALQQHPYVRIYNLDGEFVSEWPETENQRDEGHTVTAVAADDEDVYALVRSDIEGEEAATIKPLSDPEGETVVATFLPDAGEDDDAIAAGPVRFWMSEDAGALLRAYVVDAVNGEFVSLQASRRNGGDESWRREIDSFQERQISGITVTEDGIVYLADQKNAEVLIYAPEG